MNIMKTVLYELMANVLCVCLCDPRSCKIVQPDRSGVTREYYEDSFIRAYG